MPNSMSLVEKLDVYLEQNSASWLGMWRAPENLLVHASALVLAANSLDLKLGGHLLELTSELVLGANSSDSKLGDHLLELTSARVSGENSSDAKLGDHLLVCTSALVLA